MRNIESQPNRIRINSPHQELYSLGEHNGIHCLGQRDCGGEPISAVDFRLYQIALTEAGHVLPEDARKKIKELRQVYKTSDAPTKQRIANTIFSAFEGLVGNRKLVTEPITIPEEHIIYVNRS